MGESIASFDIGNHTLKIAICRDGIVNRVVRKPLPENYVKDGRPVSVQAMADFIETVVKDYKIKERKCALVLSDTDTFVRTLTTPAISIEKLKLNLPYEFKSYVKHIDDKYVYDYSLVEMINDDDGKPKEMTVLAAATPKKNIDNYRIVFKRAGLKLLFATPQECAYSYLIKNSISERQFPEEEKASCIIDVGHTSTRVYIYKGGNYEVQRVIDIGMADIDRIIADECNVDIHVAADYKESNYEGILEDDVCTELYKSIAIEILKTVNFYMFNNKDTELKNIFIYGGGSSIKTLCDIITDTINIPRSRESLFILPTPSEIENSAEEYAVEQEYDLNIENLSITAAASGAALAAKFGDIK